jgi:hypothetical protein
LSDFFVTDAMLRAPRADPNARVQWIAFKAVLCVSEIAFTPFIDHSVMVVVEAVAWLGGGALAHGHYVR